MCDDRALEFSVIGDDLCTELAEVLGNNTRACEEVCDGLALEVRIACLGLDRGCEPVQ